jgi:hypothetical protein
MSAIKETKIEIGVQFAAIDFPQARQAHFRQKAANCMSTE